MPFDPNAAVITVGVVGTGSMGRGIMQVAAQGGMRVVAYDEKAGAAEATRRRQPTRPCATPPTACSPPTASLSW
jgi:3-hydroxyisobutyrate dehydrogenase-like beta-hydroxyacid dehydrogenase